MCASFFVRTSAYTLKKTARGRLSHISCCRHIGKFRVGGEVIMKGRNQHITKRSDGNWQVKGEGGKSRFLRYDDAERGNKAWSTHLLQSGVGVDHPSSRRQNPRKGFPWTRPLPAEGLRNRFHSDSGSAIACPLSLNRLQCCGEMRAWVYFT